MLVLGQGVARDHLCKMMWEWGGVDRNADQLLKGVCGSEVGLWMLDS